MKIFVIGAHGQIGKKIVSKLVAQGDQVYAVFANQNRLRLSRMLVRSQYNSI